MAVDRELYQARMLLAAFELGVTSTLAVSHHLGQGVPCGAASGCAVVAQSAVAAPFGVPLADLGVLIAVTLLWAAVSPRQERFARALAWTSACFATGLTLYSAYSLHAICYWCVASNAILISLACAWSLGGVRLSANRRRSAPLAAVALLSGAWYGTRPAVAPPYDASALAEIPVATLANGPRIGHGPRTLVVFGHLSCSACRDAARELLPGAKRGEYSLVWRSFGGDADERAANASLRAAKPFATAFEARLRSSTVPRVAVPDRQGEREDEALAAKLGLRVTPTIFGVENGSPTKPLWPASAAHVWAARK